mmetsp:Transcript_10970/g.16604  ORF Transcript_10970/g.16604 Transcript_10970/m.16604 type:complete len:321 (+) Transcript_10970:3-965(+)
MDRAGWCPRTYSYNNRADTTHLTMNKGRIVTRAAFDIGSGKTKMLVADVDTTLGTLAHLHLSVDASVPFKSDVLASGDARELSDGVIRRGLGVLRDLADCATRCGAVPPHAGIATDVFRGARNGEDFVSRVRREAGIDARIVSQEEEAAVGFLTAVALGGAGSGADGRRMLAWDSGGGSYQLSSLVGDDGAADAPPVVRASVGPWGSSGAWCALIERVRGLRFERQTANPVRRAEAERLVALIRDDLARTPVEPWVGELGAAPSAQIVGFGGESCIFRVVEQLSGKTVQTRDDVQVALEKMLDKSDEEIVALGIHDEVRT